MIVAVRGAAGTGKTTFAASAQALPQRLLLLDLEGKARLLPGAGDDDAPFDAVEVRDPAEIGEILDWALDGPGAKRDYGTLAIDSWSALFSEAYDAALREAQQQHGSTVASLGADQEQVLQTRVQAILRRIAYKSGRNVILTDHIAARGKEEREAHEIGRVVPLTAGGAEYFVDVILELELVQRPGDLAERRVATVIKSNITGLPIGTQLDEPTFPALLEAAGAPDRIGGTAPAAADAPAAAEELLTPAQAKLFLHTVSEHRLGTLFLVLIATGMRRGEVLGLRWSDVKDNGVRIQQTLVLVDNKPTISKPKTRLGCRFITLDADVLGELQAHRERQAAERKACGRAWADHGLVFTTQIGTPIHPRNLRRVLDVHLKKAGLPKIRLHDLRHLHASLLIAAGIDAKSISERLGHASTSFTLDRYGHIFNEHRERSALPMAVDSCSGTTRRMVLTIRSKRFKRSRLSDAALLPLRQGMAGVGTRLAPPRRDSSKPPGDLWGAFIVPDRLL